MLLKGKVSKNHTIANSAQKRQKKAARCDREQISVRKNENLWIRGSPVFDDDEIEGHGQGKCFRSSI